MAANGKNQSCNESIKAMENYPCLFNIAMMTNPSQTRLKLLKRNFEREILGKEDVEGEKAKQLNVLSWIYFQLGNMKKAKEKNNACLALSLDSLVVVGNRVFLEWYSCADASKYLGMLEDFKLKTDFGRMKVDAEADQAYFLFRLGGKYNLSLAEQLYTDTNPKQPSNVDWCRLTHVSVCRRLDVIGRQNVSQRSASMLNDIATNATDTYIKSIAFSELAIIGSSEDETKDFIDKALSLTQDSYRIFQNCGIALKEKGNENAISYLKKSLSLNEENNVVHHQLAKCYANQRMTTLNPTERFERCTFHFKKAYDLSMGTNLAPLHDMAFFCICNGRFDQSLNLLGDLIKNWSMDENINKMAKMQQHWYQSLKEDSSHEEYRYLNRYFTIALSTSLEILRNKGSQTDKNSVFTHIVLGSRISNINNNIKSILNLVKFCDQSAKQILIRLKSTVNLQREEINQQIEILSHGGRPDEALLILDILDLQENNRPCVTEDCQRQLMLDEARWELSHGLIVSKRLFHTMFKKSHYLASYPNSLDEEETAETDVIILHDGPLFRSPVTEEGVHNRSGGDHYKMYEEVLHHLFDLKVISNPWIAFTDEGLPNVERFSALVKQHRVQVILLLTDSQTSSQFIQIASSILASIIEGNTAVDVAIIKVDGEDCTSHLPQLRDVRSFDAPANHLVRRNALRPPEDMRGIEIRDDSFSGDVENTLNFFKFLAP